MYVYTILIWNVYLYVVLAIQFYFIMIIIFAVCIFFCYVSSVFRLLLWVPHFDIKAVNKTVYAPSHSHISKTYIYIIHFPTVSMLPLVLQHYVQCLELVYAVCFVCSNRVSSVFAFVDTIRCAAANAWFLWNNRSIKWKKRTQNKNIYKYIYFQKQSLLFWLLIYKMQNNF